MTQKFSLLRTLLVLMGCWARLVSLEAAGLDAPTLTVDGVEYVLATDQLVVHAGAAIAAPIGARVTSSAHVQAADHQQTMRWSTDPGFAGWQVAMRDLKKQADITAVEAVFIAPVAVKGRAQTLSPITVAAEVGIVVRADAAVAGLRKKYNLGAVTPVPGVPLAWIVTTGDGDPLSAIRLAAAMEGDPDLVAVEPVIRRSMVTRATFDDDFIDDQWHLPLIGAPSAWDDAQGSGVNIAIVDSGLDLTHPDLAPNLRTDIDIDVVGGDLDPSYDTTVEMHATWVSGLAAARGNNTIGVSGVAPLAGIVGVRLIINELISDAQMAQAMAHRSAGASAINQVGVSNNSWGPEELTFGSPGPQMLQALQTATTSGRDGRGVVYVWAAGNGGDIGDDSGWDGFTSNRFVIAVGATGGDGIRAYYSESGASLLVNAPGGVGPSNGVVTTKLGGGYTIAGDGRSGTSFAAPVVAGVAALVLSADPTLHYRDVMHLLVQTAVRTDVGNADWKTNGSGRIFNHAYGFGRVDAAAAVAAIHNGAWRKVAAPATPVVKSRNTAESIPDSPAAGITQTVVFSGVTAAFQLEHVELTVDIAHTYVGDLELTLTSPSGMVARWPHRPVSRTSQLKRTFVSTAFWGEQPNGTWTLRINDRDLIDTGTLKSWSVKGYGALAPAMPTLTAMSPPAIERNSADTIITVTGSGFDVGSTVRWNAQLLDTTLVSATTLTALVPANLLGTSVTASITVITTPFPSIGSGQSGGGTSAPLSMRVTDRPTIILNNSTLTFAEDTTATLGITVGDADDAAANLIVTASSTNALLLPSAELVVSGSGTSRILTLQPFPNRNGTVTVTVTVSDGALSASADVAVTVTPVPDIPLVADVILRARRSSVTLVGQFTGYDPDGTALTFSKLSEPTQGTATVAADGSFTWTPPATIFTGVTTFTAGASSGGDDSAPATAFIIIRDPALKVPWIISEPLEEIAPGETWEWSIRIDRTAIGSNGDLNFTLIQGPVGMAFNGGGSTLTITAPGDTATLSWLVDGSDRHVPVVIEVHGDVNFNQGFDAARILLRVRSMAATE